MSRHRLVKRLRDAADDPRDDACWTRMPRVHIEEFMRSEPDNFSILECSISEIGLKLDI